MADPLSAYLHDHLAGSHFAIELLDSLSQQYRGEDLGNFAVTLRDEIRQDQAVLEELVSRTGKPHFGLSEAVGWLSEKASRIKLRRDESGTGLGTFEALEALGLGIRGKLALWCALPFLRQS